MKYNKQAPHPWSLKIEKLILLHHNLKIPMFLNSQMSNTIEVSSGTIIVWNKLKSKLDVL